jgi:hypothetical protein
MFSLGCVHIKELIMMIKFLRDGANKTVYVYWR